MILLVTFALAATVAISAVIGGSKKDMDYTSQEEMK